MLYNNSIIKVYDVKALVILTSQRELFFNYLLLKNLQLYTR